MRTPIRQRIVNGSVGRAVAGGFSPSMLPALVGLVTGVSYLLGATSYKVGTLASPGPGTFPIFVGLLVLVPSAVYLVSEYLHPSAPPAGRGEAFWRVPAIVLTLLAYLVLLTPAGFIITATLVCGALLAILGRRPWWVIPLIAVAASVSCYYLFQMLGVPLPTGPLPY
ncbi:MAG: tripartite tricarboxylate transporter TctB family protein [Chloroflexota bacterium]